MGFVRVGYASEIEDDSVMEVMIGEVPYAICKRGGNVTALSGICPHRGGPLGQGAINGANVVCPWHAWEWNCTTGENDRDPEKKVTSYEVKIEGGDILLNIPA